MVLASLHAAHDWQPDLVTNASGVAPPRQRFFIASAVSRLDAPGWPLRLTQVVAELVP
jgi:hypothetical protein